MDVPPEYAILDERKKKEFNQITISKYKRTEVMKELINAISNQKIEEACTWLIELHCSGQIELVWKQLAIYISEQINTNLPYITQWFWKSYLRFEQLEEKFFDKNFLIEGRNNQQLRNLLADVIVVLVYSRKTDPFNKKNNPIITPHDFTREKLKERLIAHNSYLICNIMHIKDPKELQLGLNEFATNLNREHSSFGDTVYWIHWLLLYEHECKVHNVPILCAGVKIRDVKDKFYQDWIWYVWHIILKESEYRANENLSRQILSLYRIYKLNFSTSTRKKKSVHIYHAVKLLKESLDWRVPLIEKYHIRVQVCANINQLYKMIGDSSGCYVNQGNVVKYGEIRESCKRKVSKHKKKLRDCEREEMILEERTKYLKVLNIPKVKVESSNVKEGGSQKHIVI